MVRLLAISQTPVGRCALPGNLSRRCSSVRTCFCETAMILDLALLRVLTAVLVGLNVPAPRHNDEPLKRLCGEWRLHCTEDEKHTDCGSENIKMRIDNSGQAVFRFRDMITNKGTIQLWPSGRP